MYNSTYAETYGLGSADVLIGPKSQFEIVDHYMVYLGKNPFGQDLYMDNNYKEGVRYMFEDQLLSENPTALRIRKFSGDREQQLLAMGRAESLYGKSYHITKFNCEHFANYVQFNTPFSKQVENSGKGFLVAASVIGLIAIFGGFGK